MPRAQFVTSRTDPVAVAKVFTRRRMCLRKMIQFGVHGGPKLAKASQSTGAQSRASFHLRVEASCASCRLCRLWTSHRHPSHLLTPLGLHVTYHHHSHHVLNQLAGPARLMRSCTTGPDSGSVLFNSTRTMPHADAAPRSPVFLRASHMFIHDPQQLAGDIEITAVRHVPHARPWRHLQRRRGGGGCVPLR